LILSETIGRLLFPFMITFLLVFLVIFEYILGAFAEITREFPLPSPATAANMSCRLCRPSILCRLVEQLRLVRILARMEQACVSHVPVRVACEKHAD